MDIANLLITLVSGAAGGNLAGAAMKDKGLGTLGNTIAGLVGGTAGHYIAQAFDLYSKVGTTGAELDLGNILTTVGTSGVSGAVLLVIVSYIKQALNK